MNIIGQIVKHKAFGEGTITNLDEQSVVISFSIGEKKFQYPEAFGSFLTAMDDQVAAFIDTVKREKEQEAEEKKALKVDKTAVERVLSAKQEQGKNKKMNRANIAFKCNYCDGGQSANQVGFNGVCSDAIINNNIAIEHRTWCNSEDCPCLVYFHGEMSREDLDALCDDGGFVCYESQMLRDWRALAGIVQTGERKGEPMKLHQVQSNSLCVLTTRTPGTTEGERYIFAVFLVDETYEGDSKDAGYVSTTSKYKLKLSPKEALELPFWNYHCNSNNSEVPAWNSGLHRYFNDDVAALILRDISEVKKGTVDFDLAVEFFDYFCKINGITEIGKHDGALKR
ncbi:MAG: hypothetical protein VB100_05220 [Angelakisella sp.]|nr:hypothetical protein [Angelakisella sp.]